VCPAAKSLYADLQAPNKTLPVLSFVTGQATGATAALPDSVFATPIRADIVHRVIQWQEKNARLTLYKGKGRAEVRGGGRKPWKQKGTGKARVGSIRSPIWVGGGVAHPPKLKEWGHLLQKKVRRLGMRCALAAKYRDRRLVVVDSLALPEGRTKAALAALAAHGVPEGRRVLLVDTAVAGTPLAQAMANIPGATALPTIGANVKDIVLADRLFITVPALEALVARVTKTD
jgi:large subunit ribosomal protein L4